jgi:putative ABC transport system permease protein
MIPISYNVRSLFVRKSTTLATALGIGLVVFVFASVLMLNAGIKRTLGKSGRPDTAIVVSKGSEAELSSGVTKEQVALVESKGEFIAQGQDGKPLAVAELVTNVTVHKIGTSGVSNVTVRGVDFEEAQKFRPEIKIVQGRMAQAGKSEVVIGKAIAGRFQGLAMGSTFELKTNVKLTVVGVFSANDGASIESEVWGDIEQMRTAFGRGTAVSSVRVRLKDASKLDDLKASIESDPNLQLDVLRETTFYEKQSEGLAGVLTALGMVIAIFFSIGAMIGAAITMGSTIANRRREIGTLRALGFSRIGILFSFLIESTLLALCGGAIGSVAALAMGFVKFSTMNFASWSEIVFSFHPTGGIVIGSLIFASFMGVIGGFIPAVRAARTSPIQAMRG